MYVHYEPVWPSGKAFGWTLVQFHLVYPSVQKLVYLVRLVFMHTASCHFLPLPLLKWPTLFPISNLPTLPHPTWNLPASRDDPFWKMNDSCLCTLSLWCTCSGNCPSFQGNLLCPCPQNSFHCPRDLIQLLFWCTYSRTLFGTQWLWTSESLLHQNFALRELKA